MPVPEFVFTESCDHHDFNYWIGFSEADRMRADRQFFAAMRKQAGRNPIYQTLALVYFLAVRSCGWACFHYADRERDEHDLMAVLLGGEG